jgi:hypothetical protein
VGCSEDARYVNGRVLFDMTGCAFTATETAVGNAVVLRHNRDMSLATCKFPGRP